MSQGDMVVDTEILADTLPEDVADAPAEGPARWRPQGARVTGQYDHSVIPEPDGFHTMHGGVNNSDNIWNAPAPEFELSWTAETALYVPEGPTYDNAETL